MEVNFIHLQKDSQISLTEQISHEILKKILSGELAAGERLPTERDFAQAYGISRGTVKRAYAKLAEIGAIGIKKGSGSYVLANSKILELNHKKEATALLVSTFNKLHNMGLSSKEIINLVNLHYGYKADFCKINIIVVSNNHEILAELEQQLAYLSNANNFLFTLTFSTLDMIEGNPDPIQMLLNYDLIIATSIDYPAIYEIVPPFRHKIVEATLTTCTDTLIALSTIPRDKAIHVIYRTHVFRKMILNTLLSLGFAKEKIVCYFEHDYKPECYRFPDVGAVINFNESPVYLNPLFKAHNKEYLEQGGQLVHFNYRIERHALIYIEDRIQALLDNKQKY